MTDTPKTLIEAVTYFADPAVTFKAMLGAKWPDGKIACPKCNGESVGVIASRSMLQCKAKDCRKQFSCKVGTIFEDSPLGLDKWFVAVWCIAQGDGVSSVALGKAIGIPQPTAWSMFNRLRLSIMLTHRNSQSKRRGPCKKSSIAKSKVSRRTASVATALSGAGGAKGLGRN